ncbi:MAG: hypothetical protein IKK92_06935 [Prevotella sp.]|nr:hypothetical protein [Bacteroidaceae bacterium]MBR6605586.1 hypothetical protein [Prevotella sp.]
MKYKAILKNAKGEIESTLTCNTKKLALEICTKWQLKHEYDFWETEIEEVIETTED